MYYMNLEGQAKNPAAGYAMAALLVGLAVMAVAMTIALPAWRHEVQREKEEELIFRGRQYVRAIQLFQRKYAAATPPSLDVLTSQKFLRKQYKDPMVEDGEFEVLYQGSLASLTPGSGRGGTRQGQGALTFDSRSGTVTQAGQAGRSGAMGGVVGVRSKSTEASIRVYNGGSHYNEWQFIFVPASTGAGQGRPGMGGGRGSMKGFLFPCMP